MIENQDKSESYRDQITDEICTTLDDLEQIFDILEQKIN